MLSDLQTLHGLTALSSMRGHAAGGERPQDRHILGAGRQEALVQVSVAQLSAWPLLRTVQGHARSQPLPGGEGQFARHQSVTTRA